MKNAMIMLALTLVLNGCATVFGNSADITIHSDPVGAEVWLDGKVVGHTPVTVEVPGDSSPYLVVKAPGYQPKTIALKAGRNGTTYANVLWGPFYGIANSVDTLSGNVASIEDAKFNVTLEPTSNDEELKKDAANE
ncbi:PEGA domain-containing protein [Vibrio cholerae]